MRNEWIIHPGVSSSISSINPLSKGFYCKQAAKTLKTFDGLKLTAEFSGSYCAFLGFLVGG